MPGTPCHAGPAVARLALAGALLLASEAWPVDARPDHGLPTDPALAALLAQVLGARPEVDAAKARVEAARQLAPQALALPDPMLELGAQNDDVAPPGGGGHEAGPPQTQLGVSLMASQQLPWLGKLWRRAQLAELAPLEAGQRLERARLTIEAEVRRAYLSLVLSRDRLELLGRLEELWKKSAEVARRRYEVGDGAQSDVLRAQLELTRVKQRRAVLQADERRLVQTLNQLGKAPLDAAIATPTHLKDFPTPPPIDVEAEIADALARSPELQATILAVTAADSSISLARVEYLPDLTLRAGVMHRSGMPLMWQLSIGGTLPVYAELKQSRALEEARARLRAASADLEAARQLLERRVRERATALAAQLGLIGLYQEGLLIQSEATADSTLAQYQVGKVGFLAVLEASAGSIADQDAYLEAIAEAWRLRISAFEVSLGPVPLTGGAAMAAPAVSAGLRAALEGM